MNKAPSVILDRPGWSGLKDPGSVGLEGAAKPATHRIALSDAGAVEQIESRHAVWFFGARPEFSDFASALLKSGRDLVRFLWIDADKTWYGVRIEAETRPDDTVRAVLTATAVAPPFGLTARELDVLTLISGGLGNHDIAACLETSLRTITTHVERILAKLGQMSRTGAATLATDLGVLRLPTPGGGRNLVPLTAGLVDLKAAQMKDRGRVSAASLQRRPILIGTPLSLNGLAASDATEMLNGTRLAVDEINRRGGVAGRKLELRIVDCDVSNTEAVTRAVHSLIESEVDAITSGYTCSEEQVQDMVADYGAPYLHCATMEAMVNRVREDQWRLRNVFQVCPSDIHYGPRFIRFLSELERTRRWTASTRRVLVIQPRWSRMDIGFRNLERTAARGGWKIDLLDDLPLRNIDWAKVMEQVHRQAPAAIFLAYYFPEENIAFLREFLNNPARALVYTLYGPSVPAYREQLGRDADGVIWATTTGLYQDHLARGFAERYERMHGQKPGHSHAGLAYDRVNILATAWTRTDNPRAFDRVVPEIRAVIHRGVNGAYSLDNPGQVAQAYPDTSQDPSISQAHLIFQIQGGQQRILSPSPYGECAFQPPPWLERE
ncbi:ABC transporter substrate-binding protein [Lichenifustis flavocetrariae]|uniref:ABC transporter substrate-binding protein n=1 Tax=Lichenifustis flavocetrariae TaxID=2949735 RepID=A0AA42CKH8_9HYPH|nr:ABC transporter substrate-binding protein [Lichenifustis flavocetrariae]MCW6510593.1 ABC transporter substrate-binding protein [Lichenifustis flavocetrariae]